MARFTQSSTGGGNADTGDITFNGVQIIGAGNSSSDGLNAGTIQLVPDANLDTDQYLIIDPTAPAHIHVRAGGTQDESTADLIIGGERNNVFISDSQREVSINTRPATIINTYENINQVSTSYFVATMPADIDAGYTVNVSGTDYTVTSVTLNNPSEGQLTAIVTGATFDTGGSYTFTYNPTWNYQWEFTDTGYLYGPAMGGLQVSGLLNGESDLWLSSNDKVVINGNNGGEFLGDSSIANNQIATLGDLPTGATGSFVSQDGKSVTVTDGIITSIEVI